jgi:hypothetical protein
MKILTDSKTIENLYEILQTAPSLGQFDWAEKKFRELLLKGWIFWSDIEDILSAMDSRLGSGQFRVTRLYEPLGVHFEEVSYRPRVISAGVISYNALRPEYFVQLLIHLERMGFHVYAQRYVEILLPIIMPRSRGIFSDAELEIFWYKRTRLKQADVILYTDKNVLYSEYIGPIKLSSGFELNLEQEEDKPYLLRIRASKYRENPPMVEVTCRDCEYEWKRGDPESSMLHRREHKKRMTWLQPKPMTTMLLELNEKGLAAELVTWNSPEWKHKEMYNRALAFKREFHYDFIQWKSHGGHEELDVHGYLFTGDNGEIVGAGAFRNRAKNTDKPKWALQWIWLCPQERRKGHLAKRWLQFRNRFGDFIVESPVSDAMEGFLKKQGDSALTSYNK